MNRKRFFIAILCFFSFFFFGMSAKADDNIDTTYTIPTELITSSGYDFSSKMEEKS